MKKILTFGIMLMFILMTVSSANEVYLEKQSIKPMSKGNILYVDDDNIEGPWNGTIEYPYRFIKDGVNAAEEGDTVFVFSGWYNEGYIHISKTITVTGENKYNTIIDGSGYKEGFHLWADSVIISNFTIQNYRHYMDYTVGIRILSRDNVISGNIIKRCSRHGISIVWKSNNTIIRNYIVNNDLNGIQLWGSRYNVIIANTIAGNKIGIYIYDPTEFDDGYLPFGKPYNIIMKNNFYFNSRNAYFENIIHNFWRSNYWDSSDYPEVINGKIWFYTLEPHLWKEKSWKNYDWHPAQEPYNISDVDINLHTHNYYNNNNGGLLFLQVLEKFPLLYQFIIRIMERWSI